MRGAWVTAYPSREFVEAGGLLSYGPSYPDLYYRAAGLIDRILKGARPGEMPVEQPTKLELVINLQDGQGAGRQPAAVPARRRRRGPGVRRRDFIALLGARGRVAAGGARAAAGDAAHRRADGN